MRIRRPTLVIFTLLLGTGLSMVAALAVARWERANYRLQFQRQTDNLTTALQRSINRYTDVLLALGDLYAVSEQPVSRTEFNRFVQRALDTYPGIQALEWAPVVSAQRRDAFEASIQAEGYSTFQITERESRGGLVRASFRADYIPVTYLQPFADNELAFGYDLTSDLTRLTALETARDTGKIAASGRIRLVQENKNQFGFLVFLPLYHQSPSRTPFPDRGGSRDRSYLLGVFRVSDVVEESLETLNYNIDFILSDQSAAAPDQFLGRYDAATQTVTTNSNRAGGGRPCPIVDCSYALTTGGRQWAVTFMPAANYPTSTPWSALSTFIIGLLLTIIVARYFFQAQAEIARTRELSQAKIRFFSMASHELRTPLSTILLSAQTLEASALADHHHRMTERIRAAAKRMNQLLNDLLTLSRAESGKLQFAPELLNLQQFCQQLIEEVQFSFETSPEIAFTIAGDGQKAYIDPQLLRAILTNLLSNAVKYSGSAPHVALTVTCQSYSFIFQVQDQGIGIPETDQTRLYEAFYRGTNVGNIAGTGLGLSVVNACLQLHHGTLDCNSQVGQGTTFKVTLPRVD